MDNHTFQLTQNDISSFRNDGVVCLRNALSADTIQALAGAIEDLIAGIGSTPTGYDLERLGDIAYSDAENADAGMAKQYNLDLMAGFLRFEGDRRLIDDVPNHAPPGAYWLDTGCWTRNKTVRELALDSILPHIAADLLGSEKIGFFDDQMFVKQPGTRQRTAFHQDYPFFHIEGRQGCVFWAPVDGVDQENGGLSYVRGSHLWDRDFASSMFISHTPMPGSSGEKIPDIEADPDQYDLVSFDVEPGDVIIHHFRTIHGGGGNRSLTRRRRAMSLRYIGDDMRFKWRPSAASQPHHSHNLRDGDQLFCRDYPMVWPRPFSGASLSRLFD